MHQPPIPHVASTDPEIAGLIEGEARRQFEKVRLIPSENYASVAVLEATGSVLTNKYSEGYPGRRYYEGQQFIDPIETLARQRAEALFGVDHANVQPYSGSPANLAVYLAFLQPGDTIMGMALPMGGHLTHGWPVSVTGKWFRAVQYGVRADTGRLDLDQVRDLARAERPKIIFCGGTAIPRTIDFPAFAEIAGEIGAILVADIAHIAGLIAGGAHPSPVGYAPVITTTTHKTLRGPRGAMIMSAAEYASAAGQGGVPGPAGRPAQPHHGGHRGRAARGGPAFVPGLRPPGGGERPGARGGAGGARLRPGLRRHRQPPHPDRPDPPGDRRQARRQGPGPGRHRDELQHGPVRPPQALRPVRPADRHPGHHHPRPARRAHAADRGLDGRGDHRRGQGRRVSAWSGSRRKSGTCWPASRCPAGGRPRPSGRGGYGPRPQPECGRIPGYRR